MFKIHHLFQSRHGVFYLRVYHNGACQKFSLRTKDPTAAKIIALSFNLKKLMATRSPSSSNPNLSEFNLDLGNIKPWTERKHPDGSVEVQTKGAADSAAYEKHRRAEREHEIALKIIEQDRLKTDAAEHAVRQARIDAEKKAIWDAVTQNSPPPESLPLLSEMITSYIAEDIAKQTAKSKRNKKSQFHKFVKYAGDRRIHEYADKDALGFRTELLKTGIQNKTINKKIAALGALFEKAQGRYQAIAFINPFNGKLFAEVEKEIPYSSFTADQLDFIFSRESYRDFNRLNPNYYWLPFLALYSGARLEELASLEVKNIKQMDDIWYFDIPRLKNDHSERKVPLHREIIKSGFLDYVERVRQKKEILLFPELTQKPKFDKETGKLIPPSNYGKNESRRFGEYLDSINLSDPRLVFHSFRHTFITTLSTESDNLILNMALVGHIDANILNAIGVSRKVAESVHLQNYQHPKPLLALQKTMNLSFPRNFVFQR